MAAPEGNSNALIWTTDKVQELLKQLEEKLLDEKVIYLGQALVACKTTARQWRRIKERYEDTEEIIYRIELIEEDIEQRIAVGGMNGRLKSNMTQFILRSKCGYVDKVPVEPKKKKEEEVLDEATLAAIQKETGPLTEQFVKSERGGEVLRAIAGKTREQIETEGYDIKDGRVYAPDHPYIIVSDDFSFYL